MSLAASPSYLQSKPATKKGLAVPTILAVILATILALTTVVFYSQYENQANINSQQRQLEKALVLDLKFEILHPSALGKQAYTDPRVGEMVTAIRTFLTQMRADPTRQERCRRFP